MNRPVPPLLRAVACLFFLPVLSRLIKDSIMVESALLCLFEGQWYLPFRNFLLWESKSMLLFRLTALGCRDCPKNLPGAGTWMEPWSELEAGRMFFRSCTWRLLHFFKGLFFLLLWVELPANLFRILSWRLCKLCLFLIFFEPPCPSKGPLSLLLEEVPLLFAVDPAGRFLCLVPPLLLLLFFLNNFLLKVNHCWCTWWTWFPLASRQYAGCLSLRLPSSF